MFIVLYPSYRSSEDCTIYPLVLELTPLFHDLIFLGRMQCIIHAAEAIHTISIFRSTRYPLLLGGQRQCRFKSCPRIIYMTSVLGIEPQTSRSQVQHLTTEPRTLPVYNMISMHVHVQSTHYPSCHCAATRTLSHMLIF